MLEVRAPVRLGIPMAKARCAMAKVRVRKETGKLYLDFMFAGHRCREQTALSDTPANRKAEAAPAFRLKFCGELNYAEFSGSGNIARSTA